MNIENMDIHELSIEFRGICTHFRNAVSGVPHRVVLPDAAAWRPGIMTAPQEQTYLLAPHMGYVYQSTEPPTPIACPPVTPPAPLPPRQTTPVDAPGIVDGWIVSGVRLRIANATTGQNPHYDGSFDDDIPHIASFASHYEYDDSVVAGGQAACYFDVFGGSISAQLHGCALHTRITMTTNGPPMLRVAPLTHFDGPAFKDVPVGPYLIVGNSGLCDEDDQFDFLLHLLTNRTGIPEHLPVLPFGFSGTASAPGGESAVECFTKLIALGYPSRRLNQSASELFGLHADFETAPSCSNSQYP